MFQNSPNKLRASAALFALLAGGCAVRGSTDDSKSFCSESVAVGEVGGRGEDELVEVRDAVAVAVERGIGGIQTVEAVDDFVFVRDAVAVAVGGALFDDGEGVRRAAVFVEEGGIEPRAVHIEDE